MISALHVAVNNGEMICQIYNLHCSLYILFYLSLIHHLFGLVKGILKGASIIYLNLGPTLAQIHVPSHNMQSVCHEATTDHLLIEVV